MKKNWIILVVLFLSVSHLFGQAFIENKEIPKSLDAGRIVHLKEIMRIKDDHEGFYFKSPHNIKVSPDKRIYILDEYQLLQFSKQGEFIRNLYRQGQGPDEFQFITNYIFKKDGLIIHDNPQNKVVYLDLNGELEKFIKLEVKGRKNFFALYDDQYYFFNSDPPETRGDMKIIEINSNLIAISPEGNTIESKFPFPIMYMIIKAGENVFMSARARRLYCFRDEKTIYISHKNSYEIIVFGLETNVVLFRFNRKYMKVKVTEDSKKFAHGGNYGRVSAGGAWFEVPVAKYHDDVQKLVKHKDLLWIITSTIDKEKGVLVDVFNRDGEYVDNFYLRYPNSIAPFGVSSWLKLLHDGYIYAVEQDNEGSYSVVKYKIQ